MLTRRRFLGAGAAAVSLGMLPGPAGPARSRVPWDRLAWHLAGQLIRPGDTGYAMARQLELAQFDGVGPAAVAYCAGSADVSVALRFAQDNHVPVAVRSGGDSYGGYSTTTGLIVDVSRLDTVTV